MLIFCGYMGLCKIFLHQGKESPLQFRLVSVSALLVAHDDCGVGVTQSLHSGHQGFKGLKKNYDFGGRLIFSTLLLTSCQTFTWQFEVFWFNALSYLFNCITKGGFVFIMLAFLFNTHLFIINAIS